MDAPGVDAPQLAFPDAVRRRPGMFVGSTGQRGRQMLLREVASNVVDLALVGRATTMDIGLEADGTITVSDDGPGIGVGADAEGAAFLTRIATTWRDSPTADGHHPHVHLAAGTGLAVVCALSDRFEVRTGQFGAAWRQAFARGHAVSRLMADEERSGTCVTFRPDPDLFSDEPIDVQAVRALLRDLAALVPGLSTSLITEGMRWSAGSPADLLPAHLSRHVVNASDGADTVDVALAFDPHSTAQPEHRWFVNLRELSKDDDPLRRVLDEAMTEALGGAPNGPVHVVVNALLLTPEFSGPTRSRCDDPHLLALVHKAIVGSLPTIATTEK